MVNYLSETKEDQEGLRMIHGRLLKDATRGKLDR